MKPKLKLPFGTGVYETIAVVGRRPAFLVAHLDRLEKGAEILGIPKARERVESIVRAKLAVCPETPTAMRAEAPGHGIPGVSFRPRTTDPEGPVVLLWPSSPGDKRSVADALKHTLRAAKVTARNEAMTAGAWEALVLDDQGIAVEGTITNVFARVGDVLVTPGDDLFPLPGIARAIVLEEAKRLGIAVEHRGLRIDDVRAAREIFLTNALVGVQSVSAVLLPDGERHALPPSPEWSARLEAARAERERVDLESAPGPIDESID